MNEKKSRPGKHKPTVLRLIYERALTQKNIPREFLANQLINEIEELREIAPTLEVTKRYISNARNSDSPLDKPWTLGACLKYPSQFPPGSDAILLEHKYSNLLFESPTGEKYWEDFSIRKAMWIIRLQPIILDMYKPSKDDEYKLISNITGYYAFSEYTSENLREKSFDSSDLDEQLYHGELLYLLTMPD